MIQRYIGATVLCINDTHYMSYYSTSSGPFYYNGLTLIPPCISNYIHYKVWGEITYPFLNFNGETVEV